MECNMTKQYQSEGINELATALAKAQGEMTHAKKDADNPFFKSKYADLPAVIDAARPHLAKHGLSVSQFTDIDEQSRVILISQLNHSSGQWQRSVYPLNPVKNDPQGLGSAFTYARRYTYCGLTGIAATGEDDDGNAASGNTGIAPKQTQAPQEESMASYNAHKAKFVVDAPVLPSGTLDYDAFTADLESALASVSNMTDLSMYKKANGKTLNAMKMDRPDLFEYIKGEFTKYATALA